MLRAGLANFSKGVLSARLHGRVDVNAYNAGLKRGENIVLHKQGAFSIRPGFRYVSDSLAEGEWLMPFQFSDEQPYALVFGQEYLQPLTGGGVVLEEELDIIGISNAAQAVVEVQNHGYSVGDQVFLNTVDGDLGDFLNGRVWTVVADLTDDTFAINADTLGQAAFSGATGGITRADPPDPPPAVPVTPVPYEPPEPPPIWNPGGNCVADDTPILLADGNEVPASELVVGSMLWTQSEPLFLWGAHAVSAISFVEERVYVGMHQGRKLRATAGHRIWHQGAWREWAGMPGVSSGGVARVAKITVAGAHTYVSAGILSHNIKYIDPFGGPIPGGA